MTTKMKKIATAINDAFSDLLDQAFEAKFQRKIETRFNILLMCHVSAPTDGGQFTPEQRAWISAYTDGYLAALGIAQDMAQDDGIARSSR